MNTDLAETITEIEQAEPRADERSFDWMGIHYVAARRGPQIRLVRSEGDTVRLEFYDGNERCHVSPGGTWERAHFEWRPLGGRYPSSAEEFAAKDAIDAAMFYLYLLRRKSREAPPNEDARNRDEWLRTVEGFRFTRVRRR